MSTTPDPIPGDIPAGDIPAGDIPAGDIPAADIPATSIPAGDLPTTDIPVSEVPLTEPDGTTTAGDVKADREQPDLRPLYAVAGLTELLVEAVRHTLADTQHWASARMAELRFRQAELEKQAAQLRERADDLPDHVRTLPDTARTRAGDFQQQASHVYADLAGRGQRAVHSVAGRVDPVFDRLQESMEKARRAVTGRTGAGATPTQGQADIIVPTETLTGDDDLTSTPAGMPDESLVAEEVYLGEGTAPESMVDEDLATGGRNDEEGEATSQR
jgi:hypothetical protein